MVLYCQTLVAARCCFSFLGPVTFFDSEESFLRSQRREEGSGWGTHVYLWQIHFDIWQNQYNIVKLNKIKLTKKKKKK